MSERTRRARIGFAVATVVLVVVMQTQAPTVSNLPPGWTAPVMALEFARSFAEVAWLSDPQVMHDVRMMHRVDTFFPIAYGGLMAFWAAKSRLGVAAAVGTIPADWYENHVLMRIADALENGAPVQPWLDVLPWATSVKWGLIAVSALAIAWVVRPWWIKATAGLAAVGVVAAIATFSPVVCEAMGLAVVGFFGALIFTSARREDVDADRQPGRVAEGT